MALFADIADDPALGGKARSLARLAAAGLRTPPGFVITDALFRALHAPGSTETFEDLERAVAALKRAPWPPGFLEGLQARLHGSSFAVRSSFLGEDDARAIAAGVYESRVDVAAAEVPAAIRAVLASALSPGAAAYARARGRTLAAFPVCVLVHRYVAGDAMGVAAIGDDAVIIDVSGGDPSDAARARIDQAVRALGTDVEIEWVARGEEVTFLQMRPYVAPKPSELWPALAELPDRERWRWDAAHNPLPLSPAQAGLVELADARCRIGIRQRVLGGYLFWRPDERPARTGRVTLDELVAAFETRAQALGERPALEEALSLFLEVYEPLFAVVQPAARAARAAAEGFLRAHAPGLAPQLPRLLADVPSKATRRRVLAERLRAGDDALGAYLAEFGDEAPAWDVAAPTWREDPGALRAVVGGAAAHPEWGPLSLDPAGLDLSPLTRGEVKGVRLSPLTREVKGVRVAPPPPADPQTHEPPPHDPLPNAHPPDPHPPDPHPPDPHPPDPLLGGAGDGVPPLTSPRESGERSRPGGPRERGRHSGRDAAPPARDPHPPGALALPPHLAPEWERLISAARAAVAVGEDDDWLYARAQAVVRRALLRAADEMRAQGLLTTPDDIFFWPLDRVRAVLSGAPPPANARDLAARGRAEVAAALAHPPPLAHGHTHGIVRGAGTGGRAIGRVVHRHRLSDAPPPDAVLVAVTLLPTELPLLDVAALVTETGGPLGHVAAQARERHLPAVVGAAGAVAAFPEGTLVLVDADGGLVVPL